MATKACTRCTEVRPVDQFHWAKQDNGTRTRRNVCAPCRRQQFREWSKTDHGKSNKRTGILRRKYGISDAEYAQMLATQDGKCAICRQPETKLHWRGKPMILSVDHDHQTGAVRSLLCSACNVGLGSFADSPERLRAAADYIEQQAAKVAPQQ